MVGRVTWLVLVAALAAGCERAAQPGESGQQGNAPSAAPADAGAQPSGETPSSVPLGSPAASAVRAVTTLAESLKPQFKEVTIPRGTALRLTLTTAVGSDTSRVEDPVRATLANPIEVDGFTALPAGAEVAGTVTGAERSGRVKGRATLALRFDRLTAWNETHDISTARISRQAAATKGEDAAKIGIGAGAGTVIGAIAGGKKGAAIGGAVGAGAGTGVVVATRGEEVRLAAGTTVRTTLQEPLTVRVPVE